MTWLITASAAIAVAGVAFVNSGFFNEQIEKASLSYLSGIQLKALDESGGMVKSSDLWQKRGAVIMVVRRPGCSLCREEAGKLSSLKPKLDEKGTPLIAVVHQTIGVEEFKEFFKGKIYLDEKRKFYGPFERWENIIVGFLRVQTWTNALRAYNGGYKGNMEGEGRLMGGLFVLGSANQGILLEYREKAWGDHADLKDVVKAVEKIQTLDNSEL